MVTSTPIFFPINNLIVIETNISIDNFYSTFCALASALFRCANLDVSDPVRSAFDTLVKLHNYGQTNWWTEVITLL